MEFCLWQALRAKDEIAAALFNPSLLPAHVIVVEVTCTSCMRQTSGSRSFSLQARKSRHVCKVNRDAFFQMMRIFKPVSYFPPIARCAVVSAQAAGASAAG